MKYRLPKSHWTQLHISPSVVAFWVFNKSLGCYSVFLWTRPRIVWNEWIYSAETRARPQDRVKMISVSSITFKTHLQTQGSDFRPSSSVFLLKIPPVRFFFALVRKEGRGKKTFTPISTSVGSPLKVKTNQNVQMRLAVLCVNCSSLRKLSLLWYLFTGLKIVRVVGLPSTSEDTARFRTHGWRSVIRKTWLPLHH